MNRLSAFSLIELLIVLAIVAVLSSVAIPAYNEYLVKAHVLELLVVAEVYKAKVIENSLGLELPNNGVHVLDTNFVDSVTVRTLNAQPAKFVVQVVAKMRTAQHLGIGLAQPAAAANALAIQLQGTKVGEIIAWTCHVAPEYNEYVPSSCKNNDIEVL